MDPFSEDLHLKLNPILHYLDHLPLQKCADAHHTTLLICNCIDIAYIEYKTTTEYYYTDNNNLYPSICKIMEYILHICTV